MTENKYRDLVLDEMGISEPAENVLKAIKTIMALPQPLPGPILAARYAWHLISKTGLYRA